MGHVKLPVQLGHWCQPTWSPAVDPLLLCTNARHPGLCPRGDALIFSSHGWLVSAPLLGMRPYTVVWGSRGLALAHVDQMKLYHVDAKGMCSLQCTIAGRFAPMHLALSPSSAHLVFSLDSSEDQCGHHDALTFVSFATGALHLMLPEPDRLLLHSRACGRLYWAAEGVLVQASEADQLRAGKVDSTSLRTHALGLRFLCFD